MEKEISGSAASSPPTEKLPDVPAQIFGSFLQTLTENGVASELVDRLRKTLLEDKAFTDRALKNAILGEDMAA
ncbi:MAG: hypothetical protein WC530_01805 [Candidatus Omnitrophota bacterium]|jgi:hypothetical protein